MLTGNNEQQQPDLSTENPDSINPPSILIVRDKISNTPFYVNGTEETGYFLTIGNYKITTTKPTITEAIDALETERWEIIVNLIAVVNSIDKTKNN